MNFDKLNKIISEDNTWKEANEGPFVVSRGGVNRSDDMNEPQSKGPFVVKRPGQQDPSMAQNNQIKGNVNIQKLSQYLPSQDPMKLKLAVNSVMRGRRLNNLQLISLGNAFIDLLKANPQETMQIMNLLKRTSMEAGENQNEEV